MLRQVLAATALVVGLGACSSSPAQPDQPKPRDRTWCISATDTEREAAGLPPQTMCGETP